MNFSKRVLSVILTLIMVCSVVTVSSVAVSASTFPAYDSSKTNLVIGTANYYGSGDVKVPVSIGNNPGIWGANFQVKYDTSSLTYKGIEAGSSGLWNTCSTTETNGVITVFMDYTDLEYDYESDGVLFNLLFTPKKYSVGATYPVSFTYVDRLSIINVEGKDVELTYKNGGVKCLQKIIKPSVPVMSSATVTAAKTVTVKWNKAANATSYDVQRKIGSGSWKTVKGSTTSLSYVDKSATAGGTYSYRIVAKRGSYTATSSSKTVKVMAYTTKPTVKSAKSGSKKALTVTLKSKITNASGYEVLVGTNSKVTKYKKSTKTTKTSVKIKSLKSKKTYYVKVRAYQKVGTKTYYGAWSSVKKASNKIK